MSVAAPDDETELEPLLWGCLLALLIPVTIEGFLRAVTRIFALNFDAAGPNATIGLVLFLVTGWSLTALGRRRAQSRTVYAASGGLLAVAFVGTLADTPLVAGVSAVALLTAATPPLAGLYCGLRSRVVPAVAAGILLTVGLRTVLHTVTPYATPAGRLLFGALVALAALLSVGLAVTGRMPATDWSTAVRAPAPLFALLLAGAGYLAQPWTVARWALHPYPSTVAALVVGVVVGVAVVAFGPDHSSRGLAAWAVVFLGAVAVLVTATGPGSYAWLAPAWTSALVLLAGAAARVDTLAGGSGRVTVSRVQALGVVALLGSSAATHWAFFPAPLGVVRGLGTEMLLLLHATLPLSVAAVARPAPAETGVDLDRRAALASVPAALFPAGGLLFARSNLSTPAPRDGSNLRVMALNLHAFFDGTGGHNLRAARDLVEAERADIVAVCESDGLRPTAGHVDGLRWLGAELGYHTAFGAGTRHRSYGVGLLSRWPIENVEVVELPVERSLTRLALVATVRAPGGPVPVVSTHLSIGAEDGTGDAKPAQIQRILDRAGEFDRAVVAGDFNLRPDQPEYDRLTAKFTDAWRAATERTGTPETYTPQRPRKRIDYVFLQGEWTVHEAATVGSEHVSDHKGVLAEIERATE